MNSGEKPPYQFIYQDMAAQYREEERKWVRELQDKHNNPMKGRFQEPIDTSKQAIRARYLGHVAGYQPIKGQNFPVWWWRIQKFKLDNSFLLNYRGSESEQEFRISF